jgi:ketosteroid isomerase-like protein
VLNIELASATLGAGTPWPVVALREESGGGGEMADFDEVREQYHRALETYILGDPGPVMRLWSTRDDVTLANPIGPPVRGRDGVREAAERAALQLRDGEAFSLECIAAYATADLAYEVNIERSRVKVGGAEEVAPTALRTTTIFRHEDDGWRIVGRHADPIIAPGPLESIVRS